MRTINRNVPQTQFAGDLVVFARVVEKGGFTAAASALGMAKSQVTKHVKRLEDNLGVTLLHRTTRQMTATQVGLSVLRHAKALVESASAAAVAANFYGQSVSGRLSISASTAYGQSVIANLLPAFIEKYPLVDLELLLTDRYVDLLHEDVDIAFRLTNDPPGNLVGRPCHKFFFLVACTPDYLHDHPVDHPSDLKRVSCMAFNSQTQRGTVAWQFKKGQETINVDVKGPLVVNSSEVIRKIVLNGSGVGLLPDFMIDEELRTGKLIQLCKEWSVQGPFGESAWMLWLPQKAIPPAMRAFIDYVFDCLPPNTLS